MNITYSLSSDFPSGVDLGILHEYVKDSGLVSEFSTIQIVGDSVVINGSCSDKPALDALIANYADKVLVVAKGKKCADIDTRTRELIGQGFTFDGQVFSLSPAAQRNWSGLKTFESIITWPTKISTIDDGEYELDQANLAPFTGLGVGTVITHYASGRALKIQANAAGTVGDVEAVIDSR